MGAFLEKPKTDKLTAEGEKAGLRFGLSAMQGWRMEMEDAHVYNLNCIEDKDCSFFGVFDGHAGTNASRYSAAHLLPCILDNLNKECIDESVTEAIHKGFLKLDRDLAGENSEDRSGTTAVVVFISPKHIFVGNCGDSRGLLCRSNSLFFYTSDHKPYVSSERNRIEKAGGTVMMQRVNGSLAVSRALGDFDYKKQSGMNPCEQLVSPEPDVTKLERDPDDQFLLLACDGVFDVMTNEEVVEYVLHRLELTKDLAQICSDLIDVCLNKNSRDNMSVILVTFPNAPKVSENAIKKEKQRIKELFEEIDGKLKSLVEDANDPLDLEESFIIQELCKDLDQDISEHRPKIAEMLYKHRKEKFGNTEPEEDFASNQMDPGSAPFSFGETANAEFPPLTEQGKTTTGGEDDLFPPNVETVEEKIGDAVDSSDKSMEEEAGASSEQTQL